MSKSHQVRGHQLSRLAHIASLGTVVWFDLLRASGELAYARIILGSKRTAEFLGSSHFSSHACENVASSEAALPLIKRVTFAVPAMSARVPWRSDCMVQALAAQRWLAKAGLPSEFYIGVRKGDAGCLVAHAWLMCRDHLVTGGDISGYDQIYPEVSPTRS